MKVESLVVFALIGAFFLPRLLAAPETDSSDLETKVHSASSETSGPRTAKAFRDRLGHFSFDSRMNGKSVKVLVDTGASSVAINESTAKRIGLKGRGRGTVRVNTANGTLDAQRHNIKEIRIGKVSVKNVDAFVLPDSALSGTLLGMSFLKRLRKFEFNDRTLTLVQDG